MELANTVFAARITKAVDQLREAFSMGFDRMILGWTDPPPALNGLATALEESGGKITAIEGGCLDSGDQGRQVTAWLAAEGEREQLVSRAVVDRHIAAGARLKCPRLILLPAPLPERRLEERVRRALDLHREGHGDETRELLEEIALEFDQAREEATDRFCRGLHSILKNVPGLEILIATPDTVGAFPDQEALEFIFEDLSAHSVNYWHDVGAAHVVESLCGPEQASWFDRLGAHLGGVTLCDARGVDRGLVPGDGHVDFKALRDHLSHGVPRVLRLRPGPDRQTVLAARHALESMGVG